MSLSTLAAGALFAAAAPFGGRTCVNCVNAPGPDTRYVATKAPADTSAYSFQVMEVHEEPSRAKSDAGNALRLDLLEPLLRRLTRIERAVNQSKESHVADGVRA